MLLEKYKHDYFHTVLKDRFIDSDEDDYEYWLEQQCYENAEYIEQMSDKLKNQKVSYGVLCHDYIAILKDMICKEATKKQKDISKMNAYNDCLLKFEKIFEVTKNENEKSNT